LIVAVSLYLRRGRGVMTMAINNHGFTVLPALATIFACFSWQKTTPALDQNQVSKTDKLAFR
ncbi:MAG: hypothetical protein EBR92_08200, partial [Alphaproteobacteria bacterium]|nr:hypothetical protein [Alphaproteobacteria bacterium]